MGDKMSILENLTVTPISMIDRGGNQLVRLCCDVEETLHARLSVIG